MDALVIARRLRDEQARGEQITIENFVIDTFRLVLQQIGVEKTNYAMQWMMISAIKMFSLINWSYMTYIITF